MYKAALCFLLIPLAMLGASGTQEKNKDTLQVLVYISGVLDGSPTYQALADGANEFAADHPQVTVKVYEAGYNQAEWESQLTSLVASGTYDLVLTTNPSMPEICNNISKKFPKQKFVVTDGYLEGNPNICTYSFDQYQQAQLLGYLAGLVTTSNMKGANKEKKIGYLVAQDYPLLNDYMIPGYLAGARKVDKDITLDKRMIGNWFDASKAKELTDAMVASGVDVMALDIGGAAKGAIKSAVAHGTYITEKDVDDYASAPGTVIGCGIIKEKQLAIEILSEALKGTIAWGKASALGIKDGYIDFVDDSPYYGEGLTPQVKDAFDAFLSQVRKGDIDLSK
jgi:simple sugar transport system substrate-binding protein